VIVKSLECQILLRVVLLLIWIVIGRSSVVVHSGHDVNVFRIGHGEWTKGGTEGGRRETGTRTEGSYMGQNPGIRWIEAYASLQQLGDIWAHMVDRPWRRFLTCPFQKYLPYLGCTFILLPPGPLMKKSITLSRLLLLEEVTAGSNLRKWISCLWELWNFYPSSSKNKKCTAFARRVQKRNHQLSFFFRRVTQGSSESVNFTHRCSDFLQQVSRHRQRSQTNPRAISNFPVKLPPGLTGCSRMFRPANMEQSRSYKIHTQLTTPAMCISGSKHLGNWDSMGQVHAKTPHLPHAQMMYEDLQQNEKVTGWASFPCQSLKHSSWDERRVSCAHLLVLCVLRWQKMRDL